MRLTSEAVREMYSPSAPAPESCQVEGHGNQPIPHDWNDGTAYVCHGTPRPSFQKGAPASKASGPKPASDASVKYMRTLIERKYPQATEEYIQSVIDQGQSRVSKAIDKLQAMPNAPRPNAYTGLCQRCKKRVGVKQGYAQKNADGKWETFHHEGGCVVLDLPFSEGRYALRDEDGTVRFYHIGEDGIYAQASDDLHPITNRQHQTDIISKIALDPKAAKILYGKELGVCGRCGKTLTSEWRKEGIGPVCAEKEGWVL